MTKRTKVITVAVLVIVVLVLLVAVALAPGRFSSRNRGGPNGNTPADENVGLPQAGTNAGVTVPVAPTPVTKEPGTQSTLEALAKTFAERYGSYSSHSGLSNLRELQPIMTSRMAASAAAALPQARPDSGFYGVTTKVLSVQIIALNEAETEAQLAVQTQRSETRTGQGAQQSYRKLTVSLIKESGGWKVDQATWQ